MLCPEIHPPGQEGHPNVKGGVGEQSILRDVPITMNRFYSRAEYPWQFAEPKLQEALDIAMDYLEYTGQGAPYYEIERRCASVILDFWKIGVRHRIALANSAIESIEKKKPTPQASFYPRAG
jgi:hypothetical protein